MLFCTFHPLTLIWFPTKASIKQLQMISRYRFNFTDYPYLSNIVLETMKGKQKDANRDNSDLVEKLYLYAQEQLVYSNFE